MNVDRMLGVEVLFQSFATVLVVAVMAMLLPRIFVRGGGGSQRMLAVVAKVGMRCGILVDLMDMDIVRLFEMVNHGNHRLE